MNMRNFRYFHSFYFYQNLRRDGWDTHMTNESNLSCFFFKILSQKSLEFNKLINSNLYPHFNCSVIRLRNFP